MIPNPLRRLQTEPDVASRHGQALGHCDSILQCLRRSLAGRRQVCVGCVSNEDRAASLAHPCVYCRAIHEFEVDCLAHGGDFE